VVIIVERSGIMGACWPAADEGAGQVDVHGGIGGIQRRAGMARFHEGNAG